MLSEGNFEEARKHVRKVTKDTESLGQAACELQWLSAYISGLVVLFSGQLSEARRFLDKTKQFAETQGEFRFRALCTRALGEVAFLKQDLLRARAQFRGYAIHMCVGGYCPRVVVQAKLSYIPQQAVARRLQRMDSISPGSLPCRMIYPLVWIPVLRYLISATP